MFTKFRSVVSRLLAVRQRFGSGKAFCVMVVSGIFAGAPAHAGIPVIDVAGLVQAILSVLDQITQIENQISQIEGQVDHYKSITGSRGLGEILNNPALQNYIPASAMDDYKKLSGGYGSLSGSAKSLRDAEMVYNCMEKSGAEQQRCQSTFAKPYQQKAQLEQALKSTEGRLDQIKSLMGQISSTGDEKAIAELNARIASENAMLQHENSRSLITNGIYEADARAEANRKEEERLEMVNRSGSIMDKIKL
jgi:type IV secretion system protein VirB5